LQFCFKMRIWRLQNGGAKHTLQHFSNYSCFTLWFF